MKFVFADRFADAISRRPWLTRLVWRVEAAVMTLLWWTLKALGPERASRLGSWILGVFGPRSRKKARLVRQSLRLIRPEADATDIEAMADQSWSHLGAVFGEYANLARIGRDRLELVDHADLARYRSGERSAIFFGAHYANWELLALALAQAGIPMVALYAPVQNPHLDALLSEARLQLGCATHARGDSVRPLLRHLRKGGSVGTLIDLRVADGAEVDFFGHPTRMPTTAARLALGTNSDLIPMVAERTGVARYRVTAGPALDLDADGRDEAAALAVTQRMLTLVEGWIRDDPSQWLLANRRWDKRVLDPQRGTLAAAPP